MPTFRCTLTFEAGIQGWSETFYRSSTSHGVALTKLRDLAKLRRELLGADVFIRYARVSDEAILRDSLALQLNYVQTGALSAPVGPTGGDFGQALFGAADIPNTALVLRIEAGPLYHGAHYLRGVPDSLIVTPDGPANLQGWASKFDAWVNELTTQGWQLRVRKQTDTAVRKPIDRMQPQLAAAGSPWVFTVAAHNFKMGNKVRVTSLKVQPGSAKGNGAYKVADVLTPDTFTLQGFPGSGLNAPYLTPADPISGWVQLVDWAYVPIDDVLVRYQGSRRAGLPFGVLRGRRPIRR